MRAELGPLHWPVYQLAIFLGQEAAEHGSSKLLGVVGHQNLGRSPDRPDHLEADLPQPRFLAGDGMEDRSASYTGRRRIQGEDIASRHAGVSAYDHR